MFSKAPERPLANAAEQVGANTDCPSEKIDRSEQSRTEDGAEVGIDQLAIRLGHHANRLSALAARLRRTGFAGHPRVAIHSDNLNAVRRLVGRQNQGFRT